MQAKDEKFLKKFHNTENIKKYDQKTTLKLSCKKIRFHKKKYFRGLIYKENTFFWGNLFSLHIKNEEI